MTDIAVLVVAADDGVMPQTEEAISHARAAEVPIVVALNKIDLPGINMDRIYEQLADNGLLPSEWGGETEVVKTSAATGEGIDKLLETLLTVAELHDYKADPDRPAAGACLESELHEGRGVVAKLLVRKGTLRLGDVVVCGSAFGRVKAMYDTLNPRKKYEEAGPSTPVNVTGLDSAPARATASTCSTTSPRPGTWPNSGRPRPASANWAAPSPTSPWKTSTSGWARKARCRRSTSSSAPTSAARSRPSRRSSRSSSTPEVQVKILQATVGGITEADVHLAHASDAIIIGFSVVPDEGARTLADKLGVQIRRYDIIYQITDDLRAALEGMLKPEKKEKDLGRALVQQAFHISRVGTVAGCRVLAGVVAARRPRAADPRKPRDRRLRHRVAPAGQGRCPRGPRRLRVRHQAGRLQRHQARRRAGGLQDRGNRPNVLEQWPVVGGQPSQRPPADSATCH